MKLSEAMQIMDQQQSLRIAFKRGDEQDFFPEESEGTFNLEEAKSHFWKFCHTAPADVWNIRIVEADSLVTVGWMAPMRTRRPV